MISALKHEISARENKIAALAKAEEEVGWERFSGVVYFDVCFDYFKDDRCIVVVG